MPQSPNFTVRSAHVNVPLTQFSVGYHPLGMIAEQVFPVVPVSNESDFSRWTSALQLSSIGSTDISLLPPARLVLSAAAWYT